MEIPHIHIVGKKNHGKTTLVEDLVRFFTQLGWNVGTIKHSAHNHPLDQPGKDSDRHRKAGAAITSIITNQHIAIHTDRPQGDFYSLLEPLYSHCQLVLIEGHIEGNGPKLEVWRAEVGGEPLACIHQDIAAVVSDDQPPVQVPVLPRSQLEKVAQKICQILNLQLPQP